MKLHCNTENGKETIEISVEDFLRMGAAELSALNIVGVNASHKEMQQIKGLTEQMTEEYAALQEQYGYTGKSKSKGFFFKLPKGNIADYISMYENLDVFKRFQEYEASLRDVLASNHQNENDDLRIAEDAKVAEEERLHQERTTGLATEQQNLEANLQSHTDEMAAIDATIAEKQRQLEELQKQQANYDTEVQRVTNPNVLTQAYMQAIHDKLDTSITNIKGRGLGRETHKLWVTNGGPLDANGKPMTNFNSVGKVIGTVHSKAFPDMNCMGTYGVNYCSMAVVSCINGVDKACDVDILNTNAFDVQTEDNTETITPYASGWVKNGEERIRGESLSHRPDTLMCAFIQTPYVSGAEIDESKLLKRDDGSLAIDKPSDRGWTVKIGTNAIKLDGVSLKDVCEEGELITDELTQEKYYSFTYNNGSQDETIYVKDGDVICIDTPRGATNTTSGYHTIMVNIDQKSGEMTYTAGNGDHVREPIKTCSYYDCQMSNFHTSDFARDKIASFDDATRLQIAQGLGLLDGLDKSQEIAQLQEEINQLNQQREALRATVDQETADLGDFTSKVESENDEFQATLEALGVEREKNETTLATNQSEEAASLDESLRAAAIRLFSGESLEDVLGDIISITPKQAEQDLSTRDLKRWMKLAHSNNQTLTDRLLTSLTTSSAEIGNGLSSQLHEQVAANTASPEAMRAAMIERAFDRA